MGVWVGVLGVWGWGGVVGGCGWAVSVVDQGVKMMEDTFTFATFYIYF